MKKIPWWTIAAVVAGALLLYGQFGRFSAEGRDTPHSGQDTHFDPSTARLVAAPDVTPAPPANTEKRVGPSDDALEVSQAVHAEASQTRAAAQAQATAPAY